MIKAVLARAVYEIEFENTNRKTEITTWQYDWNVMQTPPTLEEETRIIIDNQHNQIITWIKGDQEWSEVIKCGICGGPHKAEVHNKNGDRGELIIGKNRRGVLFPFSHPLSNN